MQTEGKRQLIKHKITWCFIRLVAGFMGVRLKMACILHSSCGERTARPGLVGNEGGYRGAGDKWAFCGLSETGGQGEMGCWGEALVGC